MTRRIDPEVLWGLIYTHNRANANSEAIEEATATLEALIEVLVDSGAVSPEALEEARERSAERVRERFRQAGMGTARQDFPVSKYRFAGAGGEIDCENRVHLCRAACCKLSVGLSQEDLLEGVLQWDTSQPYLLARRESGHCVHLDTATCACTVYAQRPIPCRGYDCRRDKRVWLDFEARIPNPRVADPDWPDGVMDGARPAAAAEPRP